ncbi:MAG: hydrogenase maturation protease [Leptolyngbyaceae cyanobacterium]|uniref:hydrogenase maturation protease n=1 Tax=Leptodesmis TaxID=2664261 RepID=UPI001F20E6D7|nr:hydrogenase maturation protease [Leptodesmis sichuanensis]UIE40200.1 hydrogenase maturation protease [Leptodesmis sichuanensis A121]
MNYLVIGYGNSLRGDDGAGQRVAEQVEDWHLDNVRSLALHQLTPEVAADIAEAGTVIFVDATLPTEEPITQVQLVPIQAQDTPTHWAHFQDPRSLLTLTQRVYGTVPPSWWILIPAIDFEFGEQFSAITQQGIRDALIQIKDLLND